MTVVTAVKPTSDDRIRAALWFAEHGFGVFSCWSARDDGTCRCPAGAACGSPGKHPITTNGFQEATRDEKRIRAMLAAASRPNYGLVCPEGVFVWDVDGDRWEEHLASLEARHGPLPPTLRTETRNGQHVFLRWPEGHPRPLHRMFGWVTRWGSGKQAGYVIGPRSVHSSGFAYAPLGVFEIATLPEPWARAVLADETDPGTLHVSGRTAPEQVQVGGRHDDLRDTARFYAGVIRDPDELYAAVWARNLKFTQPKTEAEVRRAIGDALTKFPADPTTTNPETGEVERAQPDELGILSLDTGDAFPRAPAGVAFGGLVGECVRIMAEGTDASEVGLLVSFLAVCGAMVPGHAYSRGDQTTSPFVALVGESGTGRKGTAMNRALDAARLTWQSDHVNQVLLDGLNSGEALVTSLHERKTSAYNMTKTVVGLVFEEEFVSMLASRSREGSTLDAKLRVAFDGGSLSNRRSAESRSVQPPYWLPALAGITPRELRTRIGPDAIHNGSANRWLFVPVEQRKVIAPDIPPVLEESQTKALIAARGDGRPRTATVHPGVSRRVSEYADFVLRTSEGIAQDLVKRYATIAIRLALIHAVVERSTTVQPEHLERSLEVTEYARRGLSWVFGRTVGNRDADLLLRHLMDAKVLRKNAITRGIIRDPVRQQDAIDELVRLGYATVETITPRAGGRLTVLRYTGLGGAFVPFVHPNDTTPPDVDVRLGRTTPSEHETAWTSDGRPLDERGISDGRAVDERGWLRPCRAYADHRSDHRNTPLGWVCRACDEEETA